MDETAKYRRKLKQAERRIMRWQDEKTGTSNVMLNKFQSKAISDELCPWCEMQGRCEETVIQHNKYKKCYLKSWELTRTWVLITEEKNKVVIGAKYGKLTVKNKREYIAKPFKKSVSVTWWICQCDCGSYRTVRGHDLTTGNTKSCGCMKTGRPAKNTLFSNTIYSEKKKFKYHIGSATNPDGTHHVDAFGRGSKVGTRAEHIVEYYDKDTDQTRRFYAPDRCSDCRADVRYNPNSEKQCEACGLIHGYALAGIQPDSATRKG